MTALKRTAAAWLVALTAAATAALHPTYPPGPHPAPAATQDSR